MSLLYVLIWLNAPRTVAFSSPMFLSSITPRGKPLMKTKISGRRLALFSMTVNWLIAAQSLFSRLSKSISLTRPPAMERRLGSIPRERPPPIFGESVGCSLLGLQFQDAASAGQPRQGLPQEFQG